MGTFLEMIHWVNYSAELSLSLLIVIHQHMCSCAHTPAIIITQLTFHYSSDDEVNLTMFPVN